MRTRRQALVAAAAVVAARRTAPALAALAPEDAATLTALVAYEQEVVFGYRVTLAQAPLLPGDRPTLERFLRESSAAAAALRAALHQAGGTAPPAPSPATAPPQANPTRESYLGDVIVAEEAAVARYYAAMQELAYSRHLEGSAAFMSASGRRLVVLRKMVGKPLLPRAFETGVP